MENVKIAILGAGGIGATMARTVAAMEGVELYAVGARDLAKAQAFAKSHGIPKAYGSYEELVADQQVQLVYIATPHSHHYIHAKLCLEHGKHVLCEKAFTANAAQAQALFALAKKRKRLITEAIWPRYMPFPKTLRSLLEDGEGIIGEVAGLSANLGYPLSHVQRLYDPALAGGALLDLGVYPITLASMLLGSEVEQVSSAVVMGKTGVDMQETIVLQYPGGVMATLHATMLAASDRCGVIYGTKGYMVVENVNNPESARIYSPDHTLLQTLTRPAQITGYEYEVQAAVDAIAKGALECADMPHAETLRVMCLMDELRAAWGVTYPPEVEQV